MENNKLLQILQKTVSEDEIFKLSNHTLPHISEFNRSVILEMLQDKLLKQEKISEEKVTALKNTLENYLQIYLPDQKDAWKWIILSCIYLCFICHKPLHPQEMVHYIFSQGSNKTIYYCPMKSVKGNTACVFCVCRKTKSAKNSQSVLSYADRMIVGCLCTAAVYGVFQISATALQSLEKPMQSTIITIMRQGIILIPAMLILNTIWKFDGLIYSFAVTDIIAALCGLILMKKQL